MIDSSGLASAGIPGKKRSNKKIIIIVVLAILVPIVITVVAIVVVAGGLLYGSKSVDEYKCAMAEVRKSDKAIEILGEPMEEGFFVLPNIEISGPKREVYLSTSLTGSKASGTLNVISNRDAFRSNFMVSLSANDESTVIYNGTYPCE